ncbi:MAG: hypothetical protein NDJ90_01350 [Oligoflexia bacterium]|nr:hypothetical protein [Oligoflexia bacterium]
MQKPLKNPLPPLGGAAASLKKIIRLQRDLAVLDLEMRTLRQARRLAWGGAALTLAVLGVFHGFFWLFQWLQSSGWSPGALAALAFIGFGLPAAALGGWALRPSGATPHRGEYEADRAGPAGERGDAPPTRS